MRKTLKQTMTAAVAAVVTGRSTSAPMTLRLRVSSTTGIRAKGMPKLDSTWE